MAKSTPHNIDPNEYARMVAEATRRGGGSHDEARKNASDARKDLKDQANGKK